jgi:hypothetical protein
MIMIMQVFVRGLFNPGRINHKGVKYFGRHIIFDLPDVFRYRVHRVETAWILVVAELDNLSCYTQFRRYQDYHDADDCYSNQICRHTIRLFGWGRTRLSVYFRK